MTFAPLVNSIFSEDLSGSLARNEILVLIVLFCRVGILEQLKEGHIGAISRWWRNEYRLK